MTLRNLEPAVSLRRPPMHAPQDEVQDLEILASLLRRDSAESNEAWLPAGLSPGAELKTRRVGVIGMGYVGLPLAVEFARLYPTVGFDIDAGRIEELARGVDRTREVSVRQLRSSEQLACSADAQSLLGCDVLVVAVPTPVDANNQPDLTALRAASIIAGRALQRGGLVVFESTVYPGATEEVCLPLLEQHSGLRLHRDFHLGYSPERINPGDFSRRVADIVKITSGSCPVAAARVDRLYAGIIRAGTYRAPSIRVAEAAKVIENTQRDVNIALINELAMLFHRMGIDTGEVLEAAGSKWNFLPFSPGLVGGHCVGVDPYYLTFKALQMGFTPAMVLAGRSINDAMGAYVASRVVSLLADRGVPAEGARVLVLGFSFKENCPDLRNTRVLDVVESLRHDGVEVEICDPCADQASGMASCGGGWIVEPEPGRYDAVVVAVAHRVFARWGIDRVRAFARTGGVLFDVKRLFGGSNSDGRL